MWSSERKLANLITNVIINKNWDQSPLLVDELNKNYTHFLDILKDPVMPQKSHHFPIIFPLNI